MRFNAISFKYQDVCIMYTNLDYLVAFLRIGLHLPVKRRLRVFLPQATDVSVTAIFTAAVSLALFTLWKNETQV